MIYQFPTPWYLSSIGYCTLFLSLFFRLFSFLFLGFDHRLYYMIPPPPPTIWYLPTYLPTHLPTSSSSSSAAPRPLKDATTSEYLGIDYYRYLLRHSPYSAYSRCFKSLKYSRQRGLFIVSLPTSPVGNSHYQTTVVIILSYHIAFILSSSMTVRCCSNGSILL